MGWTCCVDQGHYGHPSQKATWLYAVGVVCPPLIWDKSPRRVNVDGLVGAERRRKIRTGTCQLLSKRQRTLTPVAFRDLLIAMAETAQAVPAVRRSADQLGLTTRANSCSY